VKIISIVSNASRAFFFIQIKRAHLINAVIIAVFALQFLTANNVQLDTTLTYQNLEIQLAKFVWQTAHNVQVQ
jgi:hypothetical protein